MIAQERHGRKPLQPKSSDGTAWVLLVGRVSTEKQAISNIHAGFEYARRHLREVFDGPIHFKTSQMLKDEETRTLLRKKGYRILELSYDNYSDKKRDQLYKEIQNNLGKE